MVYYVGGTYGVLLVISFSHVVDVTPFEIRQVGICLMEMTIYMAELFLIPYGFIIDATGLNGIKGLQWYVVALQFCAAIIFTFNFAADRPSGMA